jgi:hypothetical protein
VKREVNGFVEANGPGAECLGNHVDSALPFEDVWIREMKGFLENDALIGPCEAVITRSETDLSALCFSVHDFEEHVPGIIAPKHEWIRNEFRGYVGDDVFR